MDTATWIGITLAAIIGGCLLWAVLRKPCQPAEPEQDPDSPYTPAGAAIVKSLRKSALDSQQLYDLRAEWR